MFSHFDSILACDRWTDRWMNSIAHTIKDAYVESMACKTHTGMSGD